MVEERCGEHGRYALLLRRTVKLTFVEYEGTVYRYVNNLQGFIVVSVDVTGNLWQNTSTMHGANLCFLLQKLNLVYYNTVTFRRTDVPAGTPQSDSPPYSLSSVRFGCNPGAVCGRRLSCAWRVRDGSDAPRKGMLRPESECRVIEGSVELRKGMPRRGKDFCGQKAKPSYGRESCDRKGMPRCGRECCAAKGNAATRKGVSRPGRKPFVCVHSMIYCMQ